MAAIEGACINCETSFSWSRSKLGLCWWCDPKGKKAHDKGGKQPAPAKPKRKRK
jgi:hypothetical protein